MKENSSSEINEVDQFGDKLYESFDLIRGSISASDFPFLLYFLILKRDQVLGPIKQLSVEDLKTVIHDCVFSYGGSNADELQDAYELFAPAYYTLSDSTIYVLLQLIDSLDESLFKRHFPKIFDDLLYRISKLEGKYSSGYLQPLELSRFVSKLADLTVSAKVYNPFAGAASFGVMLNKGANYLGQEQNQTIRAIGILRLMAHNRESTSNFELGDSIQRWNPFSDNFDLIVANPPFNMKLVQNRTGKFGTIRTCEQFLIEKGITALRDNGKLITVVPVTFLSRSGSEQELKKFLVQSDLLDMVISFPGGLFRNTSIPFAVVVISKNKKEKGVVRFIDAATFVETKGREKWLNDEKLYSAIKVGTDSEIIRTVPNTEISENDHNLSVTRYLGSAVKVIDGVKLGELIEFIPRTKPAQSSNGKFIRIRDLKEDRLDYTLEVSNVERGEIPNHGSALNQSALLLALRWKTIKPTYFDFTGETVFISNDLIACKVDESKVDTSYLVNELLSDSASRQLNQFRYGTVIPTLSKNDLLNIMIELPSLEAQRAKVKGIKEAFFEEKKREHDYRKTIHGLESEIHDQNSYLRHSIAGPLKNLRGSFSSLKSILETQVIQKMPELMSLKASPKAELNFKRLMEIISRDLAKVSESTRMSGIRFDSIQDSPMEKIDIVSFVKNYIDEVKGRQGLDFQIFFEIDEEAFIDSDGNMAEVYINGNADLLRDLFNNLIENAEAHAFEKNKNNKIEIFLMPDDKDGSEIVILVSNNGKRFPTNFDYEMFIRKGSKAGPKAGDGFGGYYINEILKKHNASMSIIDEDIADLATSFEFMFPIVPK